MANELIPFKEHGDRVTCVPSAAVTGKRLVMISAEKNANGCPTIAHTTAGAKAFGVAAWDAAIGGKVTVVTITSGDIVPLIASGAIAAGASVKPGAAGVAVSATAADRACGIALAGAADGAEVMVQLAHHTA